MKSINSYLGFSEWNKMFVFASFLASPKISTTFRISVQPPCKLPDKSVLVDFFVVLWADALATFEKFSLFFGNQITSIVSCLLLLVQKRHSVLLDVPKKNSRRERCGRCLCTYLARDQKRAFFLYGVLEYNERCGWYVS
jgi:hypothetical protein